jgi:geranylgeranyl diphosphate synthase type 3
MPSFHEKDVKCLEPYYYLSGIPGKDVRGSLIDCFQKWLHIGEEKIAVIKEIIASLHNASLLVDDIEDNSKLRRGVPVAHSIFGVANTINCANYVYFLALEKCHSLDNSRAMTVFVQELLNLHRGQGQDILWREQCSCPSEEMYKIMVMDKTGGLFRLAVGLMQSCCSSEGQEIDFTSLLNLLGLYFQIRDDFLNVSSIEYMQTKSFCEDLTEGKFSFPIIHAVHSRPNDTRLLSILRARTEDIDIKRHAVAWLQECGSIDYTRQVLRSLREQVEVEIELLGGHDRLTALIRHLDAQLDTDSETTGADSSHLNSSSSEVIARKINGLGIGAKIGVSTL